MPTYDYECPKCSSRFEHRRSFTDESPVNCPKCKTQSRRVFSPVPIIFKGSGFYVTDHKGNHGHSEPVAEPEKKTKEPEKAKATGDSAKSAG